jgi:2',3'-cyclic-nucleotide 2'-phosphodiesterase (5'-nucleotidase family)
MRNKHLFIAAFFGFVIAESCSNTYRAGSVTYQTYRVNTSVPKDTVLLSVLKPYSDSVNGTMNAVIGVADQTLEKRMPGCTLGYFMTDAFFEMAKQKFQTQVDVALMNYGGIRLAQLPAGNVTTGKIFELMPFDNVLILQKMKGAELQVLLDHIAGRGGWPVAGMTMQLKDKKAVNVVIGGKALDPLATYTIANSDFVANGGDDAAMLRSIPQMNIGYLMRDAIFDYIWLLKSQGKNISVKAENRVTNAE